MHSWLSTARAVAELVEKITQVKLLRETLWAAIIGSATFLVPQNMVSLGNFLEAFLGLAVAGIYVRVMLSGLFPIRLLDLVRRSIFGYTQDLIIVLLSGRRHRS